MPKFGNLYCTKSGKIRKRFYKHNDLADKAMKDLYAIGITAVAFFPAERREKKLYKIMHDLEIETPSP